MAQDGGAGEECGEYSNAVIGAFHRTYRWPPFCLLQAGLVFRVGVFSHDLNGLFFNFSSVHVMAIIGDYEW